MVFVSIRDLEVRTYDNPSISGIDLGFAQQCNILNVFINTGIYSVQAAQPTHATSGLITPHDGNGAYTMIRDIAISGYFNGIVCNEHTDGDGVGPSSAPLCAARTLNATGASRVTLSLR